MTETINRRFDDLERRVTRVEKHLGIAALSREAPPPAEARVAPTPPPVMEVASPVHDWMRGTTPSRGLAGGREQSVPRSRRELLDQYLQRDETAPDAPTAPNAPPVAAELPQPRLHAAAMTPPPLPPLSFVPPRGREGDVDLQVDRSSAPATVQQLRYEARPAAPVGPPKQSALEQVIGLKLAGWVGAIVLVIGAGLGIKYAYQQGLFAGVPAGVWLTLLYACGFALLGAGEFVFRRVNRISATGLFGAGVATLFLVSYAGHSYYGLYQQQTAFTLMALSTLVGAAVAMRGKLVSIAVVSLLGGLLAPLVLQGDTNLLTPFLAYLLMLQVVALVLSWWGGSARWWTLRGLSLAGTSLWIAAILWTAQPWGAAMTFTFVAAALYHAEVILSAFRKRVASAQQDVELGAGVSFTVIVTATLTGATLWLFRDATPAVRGLWVAGFAGAALIVGLALSHVAKAGKEFGRLRALAYGYRVQAAILLLLAIPVAFSGASVSVGWAAVALALAAIGAKLDDKAARYAAVGAWALALANGVMWMSNPANDAVAEAAWLTLRGHPIRAWAVIGAGLAFVGHAIARLIAPRDAKEAPVLSFLATGVFTLVTIAALPPLGATAVLLAYAWLLVGGDRLLPQLMLLPQAWMILSIAAAKWVVIDTIAARLASGWSAATYTPVLNPLMLTGVLVAASIVAIYWIRRDAVQARFAAARAGRDGSTLAPPILVLSLVTLLIGVGLSVEVDRVVMRLTQSAWPTGQLRHMAWTMLWTLLTSAYLLVFTKLDATARRSTEWRGAAWAIAGLLAAKFIVIDTILRGGTWWNDSTAALTPSPIVNFQMLTAIVVTAGLAFVHWLLSSGGGDDAARDERTPLRVGFAATLVLLWAGTLEIDRLVASGAFPGAAVWPAWQLKNFAWSAWWAAGVTGFIAIATRRDDTLLRRVPMLRVLAAIPVLLAVKFLVIDTMFFRVVRGPANTAVIANLQTFAGAILFGALILIRHWLPERGRVAGAIGMIMLLWLGSLEIDRAFERSAVVMGAVRDPAFAKQVALSIFWSAFAIACIAAGFAIRTAGLRYFGLALFALTLAKVGIIDLRNAQTGYRILSFMGLGALLLVTSVLYGKLSPVLLRDENREIGGGQ